MSKDGNVTALKGGSTVIRATVASGVYAECTLNVILAVRKEGGIFTQNTYSRQTGNSNEGRSDEYGKQVGD